jgi:hypothetical protein
MIIRANEHEFDTGPRPVDTVEFEVGTHTDDDGIQHVETRVWVNYEDEPGTVIGDLSVQGTVFADGFDVLDRSAAGKLAGTAQRVRVDAAAQG